MTQDSANSRNDENESAEMSFWDHLEELRTRLIKALLFVAAGFCLAYFFVPALQDFLIASFFPGDQIPLAFLAPTEGFVVRLKLALAGGIILAAPAVFYHFWRFVAPGLMPREKRFIVPIVITSTISFLVGILFSYFVIPFATRFFLSFGDGKIANTWSFTKYIDFIVRFMIAFGVVFELPLVIYFLVRLGIVTPEFLRGKRRYAIVIFLVLAAILSPPDVFTMIVLAVPLIILYELSIFVATLAHRKHQAENP